MLNPQSKKILFIVHEASFTGAPILLLNLLQLLKKDDKIKFKLIISRGGPLEKAFKQTATCIILKPQGYSELKKGFKWLKYFLLNKINMVSMLYSGLKSDIIFSNSIVNLQLVSFLKITGKSVFTYVHELEKVIDAFYQNSNAIDLLTNGKLLLYPGNTVKKTLEIKYKVPAVKLKKLNYYIPYNKIPGPEETKSVFDFEKEYRRNTDDFLVCGIGNASYRKGTDIFIEVAKEVTQKRKDIKFFWVGGFEKKELEIMWKEKIIEYNLQDNFVFTGPQHPSAMQAFYAKFDLLFLSSREDPYPLVVLEAAWRNLPSLIFKESGGIIEFVNDDAGWSVNDFSIAAAAEKIIDISNNKNERLQKAQKANARVAELHGDPMLILTQFYDAINYLGS